MLREVSFTKELNVWLNKQVNKLQAPVCQVFVQPFSKPWLLLADSVEAKDIMIRRPKFDRLYFITDGLSPFEDFHARMKTGNAWKATRAWLQDLMAPSFLNNIFASAMYKNSVQLVGFWETKARLANGHRFDVNEDLNHSALDGVLSFVFDRYFEHTALGSQIQAVFQLDPSAVEIGPNGDAKFSEAPLNEFIAALYKTVDKIDKVTKPISPRLAMWRIPQIREYRRVTAVKRQVVKKQVRGTLRRLHNTSESKTAIKYILTREKKTAEKQDRKVDYENQILLDEIRVVFFSAISAVHYNRLILIRSQGSS